jgi:TP901 family phage tail tape measure protein
MFKAGAAGAIGLGFILSFKAFGLSEVDNAARKLGQVDQVGERAMKTMHGLRVAAKAGAALMAFGGTLAAGFLHASSKATEFEFAFREVQTLFRDMADVNVPRMEQSIMDMAQRVGEEPAKMAKAMYQVISAGIQDQEMAEHALAAASHAAVGGISDTFTAVDSLTSLLNAYGLEVKYAAGEITEAMIPALERATGIAIEAGQEFDATEDIFDAMFIAIREGKTTFDELNEGLGRVAPIAQEVGLSFRDVIGTTSALTKVGLSTSEAYTGLRSILIAIEKQTDRTKLASMALGTEFDINAVKTQGWENFIKNFGVALQDFAGPKGMERVRKAIEDQEISYGSLSKKLGEGDIQRFTDLLAKMEAGTYDASEMIFWLMGRVEGANAASALLSDESEMLVEMMAHMKDSTGAAGRAFATMDETMEMLKRRIKISWVGIRKEIGDAVNKITYGPLSELENYLEKIRLWIRDEANEATVQMIVNFGMIAAALSIVIGGLLLFVAGIAAFAVSFTLAGGAIVAAIKVVGVAVLAIAALSAILIVWGKEIVQFFKNLWEFIKPYWEGFIEGIKLGWEAIGGTEILEDIWRVIVSHFSKVMDGIKGWLDIIKALWITFFGTGGETMKKFGIYLGKFIGAFILVLGGFIVTITYFTSWILRLFVTIVAGVAMAAISILAFFVRMGDVFSWMWDKLKQFGTFLKNYFIGLGNDFKNFGILIWVIWTTESWPDIKNLWESALKWLSNEWKQTWGGLKEDFVGYVNWWTSNVNKLIGLFNRLADAIPSWHPASFVVGDGIGEIPEFAEGGIVTKPTFAMVGEKEPELIIPLRKLEMEARQERGYKTFKGIDNVGKVNSGGNANVSVSPQININASKIVTATDRRNILTAMAAGKGLHYSWHGVG